MEKSSKKIKQSFAIVYREIKKIGHPIIKRWNKHNQKGVEEIESAWLNDDKIDVDAIASGVIFGALRDFDRINKATIRTPEFKRSVVRSIKRELKK